MTLDARIDDIYINDRILDAWDKESERETIDVNGYTVSLSHDFRYRDAVHHLETGELLSPGQVSHFHGVVLTYEPGENVRGNKSLASSKRLRFNVSKRGGLAWTLYAFPEKTERHRFEPEPKRSEPSLTAGRLITKRLGGGHNAAIEIDRAVSQFENRKQVACEADFNRRIETIKADRQAMLDSAWGKLLVAAGVVPWKADDEVVKVAKFAVEKGASV